MKFCLFSVLLFISLSLAAQEPDSSSALFNMREAERNFAKASVMFGRNASFVENFADESVIFTDKWLTNGKQVSKERKAAPVVLKWEPEFMDIADSRDFGISTGPWEAQEYRPNTAPLSTGYFLTVWKKQSNGAWEVILDAGSTTPRIIDSPHNFVFPAGADKVIPNPPKMNIELLGKELLDRDGQFFIEWKKRPLPSTFISFLEPFARLQLNGHLPTTNKDTINVWIAKLDKTLVWLSAGAGAATSGDMGFTYGTLVTQGTPAVIKGHYVRIWRKRPGANWNIEMEMMNIK
jgi:ketosteroid isomerase-like protein